MQIYQLKVTLAGIHPPVWRRVLVPSMQTLADLHEILQIVMGWQNEHLHEFMAPCPGEKNLTTRRARRTALRFVPFVDPMGFPMEWIDAEEETDESTVRLEDVAPAARSHLIYTYDLGDAWEHDIVVEKILAADPEVQYPVCIAGARNGAPEDCGGSWGYMELLGALVQPDDPDCQELIEWMGPGGWDPEAFDLADINTELQRWGNPEERNL